jgi:hypothetical protein
MNDKNTDIIHIISNQIDDVISSGATEAEIAEFIQDLTSDLSVRRAYLSGYLANPQEYLAKCEEYDAEIKDGPIVGILVSGIFTSFTSGLLVGLIAIAAGLIQYWLRDDKPEKKEDPKFVPVFEGSANGDVAKLGETIPVIYTSADEDSTGGVQTNGKLIYSLVYTFNGTQTLYIRYALSLGYIKNVDLNKTLINDQPLSNFDPSYYTLTFLPGSDNQVVGDSFKFHSQNFAPNNNNNVGCRLVDETPDINGNAFRILCSESEYTLYEGNSDYLYYPPGNTLTPTMFKLVNKQVRNSQPPYIYEVFISQPLPFGFNGKVFKTLSAYYRTTKRVTGLHLNFACNISGRNSNGELVDFAQLYTIEIKKYSSTNWARLGFFYIYSRNPIRILRSVVIEQLPLNVYDVRVSPAPYAYTTDFTYELWDNGPLNTVQRVLANGITCNLQIQGYQTPNTVSNLNFAMDQSKARVPDNSCQSGYSLKLQSVNELETPANLNSVNLPGICTGEAIIKLNDVINGSIALTWFINEGVLVRKPFYVGTAEVGSTSSALKYTPGINVDFLATPLFLRNLDKRIESQITTTAAAGTIIYTASSINLEEGDRWLMYKISSTCFWPLIYADLISSEKFGISKQVIGDYYLDWNSINEASSWCNGNNQHNTKFCWHGILSNPQDLASLNADNSRKVMLQPWRGDGQTGFYPQKTPPISALYNGGNSANLRLEYTTNDRNPPNTLTVVFLKQEHQFSNGAIKFVTQSVTAQTWPARKGIAAEVPQTVEIKNCTSELQAIISAQILLNIARYSGRIIANLDAKTIESMSLRVGDNFRLMTSSTVYNQEQSGVVVEVLGNEFRLDREFTLINSRSTGSQLGSFFDINMDFPLAGVEIGDLVRNRENNVTSVITGFNSIHWPICSPTVPIDTYYEVADLTTSNLLMVLATGTVTSASYSFTSRYNNGHIWHTINAPFLANVGDVVGIGRNFSYDRQFQAVAVEIKSPQPGQDNAEMGVSITGANWDSRMFSYGDVTIITRDNVINEPPP